MFAIINNDIKNHELNRRAEWIDVAKFLAILAVMVDHTNSQLYTNPKVGYLSYYSVSLFILMMGVTTFWSLERQNEGFGKRIAQKCWGIYRPYLVATLIFCIAAYKCFDLETFINHTIHFSVCAPYYYICLYMQLVVISPLIYAVFKFASKKKNGIIYEVIGLVLVLVISSITTINTNILSIYGGGGKLFGGTYLILLYVGMWFGKYYDKIELKKFQTIIVLVVSGMATIGWSLFITVNTLQIDSHIPFGAGLNPPSVSLCTYAILLALSLFALGRLLSFKEQSVFSKGFKALAFMGKHTLYIFLYHRFFLDMVFPAVRLQTGMQISNIWIKRIAYFVCMISGSMLVEVIIEKIHKCIVRAYKNRIMLE